MDSVSGWARGIFGEVAGAVAKAVPACLRRAHERARNGQEGVHTQTLEAYGHGLHAVQYEELAAALAPYGDPVRLQGRTLMLVSGHLLYPLRYAAKDVPVTAARLRSATGFRAELIRRHGPEPQQLALDLALGPEPVPDVPPDLALLPEDVRLVLIAYACSLERGVMRAEWGDAELRREDRYLVWHHHEPLLGG
ncbi:hypothetical protein ACGH2B_10165 [Streptomyces sp. BBFR2]|uniref:hypothetical protein n=1 Tax=Streptomyces sp. BBFR2 TaxID=3372854 RepID=UPI0037DA406B